jgi:hypothetical protein
MHARTVVRGVHHGACEEGMLHAVIEKFFFSKKTA